MPNYGALPRLLDYECDEDKEYCLEDLFDSIVLKDTVKGNKVKNKGNVISANSIAKYLKHGNGTASTETAINYLDYLTNAFVLYKTRRGGCCCKRTVVNS